MLWLEFTAVTLLAGAVLGFTGFGGALVMAPVFMTLVDPLTATAVIRIGNAVMGAASGALHAQRCWRRLRSCKA